LFDFTARRCLAFACATVALAWAPSLSAGGVAEWVQRRLGEQAKSFDDAEQLALEPRHVMRERESERALAGLRGGSARASGEMAAPRLALGFELERERRAHGETDGVPALVGQSDRVVLELWLGVPAEAELEASIGPHVRWSDSTVSFLRLGGALALAWEAPATAAIFDLASVELGVTYDGTWLLDASARSRGRVLLRDAESGSALLVGGGARLFAAPFALDVEWLAPLARSRAGSESELGVSLCSFLGGPSLCSAATRGASFASGEESVLRLELLVGWGSFARTAR